MGETLRKLADNSTAAALSRIAVFIVSTLSIPLFGWVVFSILETRERNTIQQIIIESQARKLDEHSVLIAEIKRTRDADRDALLALRTDLGRALEKLDGQSGSLRRIEAWIDQQRSSRP